LSATSTFSLTVSPVNEAPMLVSPIGDCVATEYVPFALSAAAVFTDVDAGDALTYSATRVNGAALPAWLAFDQATGILSGAAVARDIGTYDITVTATDRGGITASDDFTVTVARTPDMTLVGTDADDILIGRSGNDTLDGGSGADTMLGALGNDSYLVDNVSDEVIENPGEGVDVVHSGVSYTLPVNVEALTLVGSDDIDATGNALANTITGNSGVNVIDGGGGADTMAGGEGDDTYIVGSARDQAIENAGEGIDTVRSAVSYTLPSNVENLVLTGTNGIRGTGNELANTITGNAGGNVLDGGVGADLMTGGMGNDTYIVDDIADQCSRTRTRVPTS
jgi:Ca2+-binding RTX toxin-like protein